MTIHSRKTISSETLLQADFLATCSSQTKQEVIQELNTVDLHEMCYNSHNRKVKGFIAYPKDITKKYPVILYARGGSKDYGKISHRHLVFVLSQLASWGFVVLATQYSGNDGSDGKDELSGMDLDDLENLKHVAQELEYADISSIQAIGGSRGGLMVANLWRRVDWLEKVILEAPELDLIDNYLLRPKLKAFRADMYDVDNNDLNREKSPIYHIEQFHTSTKAMIIQGGKDLHVNPQKSIEFFQYLQEKGIFVDFHFFAKQDHYFSAKYLWKKFLLSDDRLL